MNQDIFLGELNFKRRAGIISTRKLVRVILRRGNSRSKASWVEKNTRTRYLAGLGRAAPRCREGTSRREREPGDERTGSKVRMWRSSHHAPGRPDARGLRDPACALEKYLCPRGVLGPSPAHEVFWKADPCGRYQRALSPGSAAGWLPSVGVPDGGREGRRRGRYLPSSASLPGCLR